MPTNPSTGLPEELEKRMSRQLARDPGFQYAFRMHALLQLFYANNKEERQRQYEEAGIAESLDAAEKRCAASVLREGK